MPFEGNLNVVSLESVLRNIDSNSLTGILTVSDSRGERQVAFMAGRLVAFLPIAGEERSVADALATKKLIERDEVEKVRSSLRFKRMNLRRALEYRGLVTEQDYAQAVRDEVIVPHVLELFVKRERMFRFDEKPLEPTPSQRDRWDEDQLAAELRILVEPLILECVRRLDEKSSDENRSQMRAAHPEG